MSVQATKQHCKLCFDVLLAVLNKKQPPKWPQSLSDVKTPIFITWKSKGNLRGCIGTFSPDRHSVLIPQYAVIAAMKDSRFRPMSLNQVNNDLSVNVSLLVNFQQASNAYDWQVGKHGIIIKADYKGQYYSATFLPEVAPEQKWDKEQTLKNLLRKADYVGKLQQIKDHIKLTRYQSSKSSLSYEQYIKMTQK